MARARNIKPGFFKNEDLAECSPWARLCFIGLWMLADREGRLEDRHRRIKGELFPYDSFEVEPLLQELARYGFIERYEVNGVRVIAIPKFSVHQTPNIKEKPSALPDKHGASTVQAQCQHEKDKSQHPLNPESLFTESPLLNSESLNLNPENPGVPPGVRAQTHATPPLDLPVDNFSEPQGLATAGETEPEKSATAGEPERTAETAKPGKPPRADCAKPVSKSGQGTRLPDDWQLPKSWGEWALGKRTDMIEADVRREAACFADYWHAKAGADARKVDWEATWRNWIRKGEGFRRQQNRTLPAARASPYPEVSDGVIPLVRISTMQSAAIAKQLIFEQATQHENERSW